MVEPYQKDILLKHVFFLLWNVNCSLVITFCMEYCYEIFLSQNNYNNSYYE